MRKLISCIAALALLGTGSCKKTEGESASSWTFGATSFPAVTVTAKPSTFSYVLVASDGCSFSPHTLIFFFNGSATPNATTPAAGTYKVVGSVTGPGQMSFSVNGSTASNVYSSTGNDQVNVSVSVVGDMLRISMPQAWATNGADSVQVGAEVTQN